MGFNGSWGGCDLLLCVDLVGFLVDLLVCISVTDVCVLSYAMRVFALSKVVN